MKTVQQTVLLIIGLLFTTGLDGQSIEMQAPPNGVSAERYYLQMGAFADPVNAFALAVNLEAQDNSRSVKIMQQNTSRGKLHKVIIDGFTSLEEIREYILRNRLQNALVKKKPPVANSQFKK